MVDMLCHLMVEKLSTGKQRRQFLRILWNRKYLPDLIRYARQNNLGLITYDNKQGLVATRVDPYVMLETVKSTEYQHF